jgi:hypothetical protein
VQPVPPDADTFAARWGKHRRLDVGLLGNLDRTIHLDAEVDNVAEIFIE